MGTTLRALTRESRAPPACRRGEGGGPGEAVPPATGESAAAAVCGSGSLWKFEEAAEEEEDDDERPALFGRSPKKKRGWFGCEASSSCAVTGVSGVMTMAESGGRPIGGQWEGRGRGGKGRKLKVRGVVYDEERWCVSVALSVRRWRRKGVARRGYALSCVDRAEGTRVRGVGDKGRRVKADLMRSRR